MKINDLKKTTIFRGMSEDELTAALTRLDAGEKKYRKGETILFAGETTDRMGLVLEGSVTIENNDMWGNRTILSHVGVNEFFAETYGLLAVEPLLVDVTANEDCRILFLRIGLLHRSLTVQEAWQTVLLRNLLSISAQKNLMLSGRILHTASKKIRGRVSSYLNSVALRTERREFDIPFDRQQMADYLNVERTALSKELRKMKQDGLIDYHKNHFLLLGHI